MDVALYHPWLKEKGGAEKVVLEAAKRSEHNITVYTLFYDEKKTFKQFKKIDIEVLGSGKKPGGVIDKGIRFGLGSVLRKIPEEKHDTLLVSEAGLGSLITLRNNSLPTLCYCHTPLRAALPEFKQTYKKEINPLIRPFYLTGLKIYSILEKQAWKNFDHIISNSKLTKERILDKKLTEEEKISILNPGADIEKNQNKKYGNYFLYPSRFRRYKRQDLAIKAFQKADPTNFKLILAGSAQEKEFIEELKQIATEKIEIETDVSDKRWKQLYENSYAVLFCAEKEDWGIIPVEAASYSKPVISVNEGGPKESVIDGKTGYLVQPRLDKFAERITYLAENKDKVKQLGKNAKKESKKYSWKKFSKKIDQKIENVRK